MRIRRRPRSAVASITTAQTGLINDQSSRQKRYFISMMVRTACFILAVALPSPYRWIALFGAVVLPYIAVLFANAGRETITGKSAITSKGNKEITF